MEYRVSLCWPLAAPADADMAPNANSATPVRHAFPRSRRLPELPMPCFMGLLPGSGCDPPRLAADQVCRESRVTCDRRVRRRPEPRGLAPSDDRRPAGPATSQSQLDPHCVDTM